MSEVHPEQRDVRLAHQLRRAQDRPVTSEDHHQLDIIELDVTAEHLGGRRQGPVLPLDVGELLRAHHGLEPEGVKAGARFLGRYHRLASTGVREYENSSAHEAPSCQVGRCGRAGGNSPLSASDWSTTRSRSSSILGTIAEDGILIHTKYSTLPS